LSALGRLGQIAGLLLLVFGGTLAAWGAPYYMLDWGSTFVMAGIALASGGLSCLLLGTILIRLGTLRDDIATLRASAAVTAHEDANRAAEPQAVAETLTADSSSSDGPKAGFAGGIAGVAAAGAAAGGLAVAAKSILTSVNTPEPEAGAGDAAMASLEDIEVDPDRAGPTPAALTDDDRASLDDLLAKLSLPVPADDPDDAQADAGIAGEAPAAPGPSDAEDLYARIDEATSTLQAEALDAGDDAKPTAAPSAREEMNKRIEDEFAGLRAELAAERDAEAAAQSQGVADDPEDTDAEASGVTDDAINVGDEPVSDTMDDDEISAEAAATSSDEPDDGTPEAGASAPDSMDSAEPESSEAIPAERSPAASSEGVVAAYNVGDTSYAMFADGRIRVSAPEGQFMLGSMDELKSFMAARRT
jgi:hypothetical protein